MEEGGKNGCRATSWPPCTDPVCGRSSLDSPLSAACLDAWVPVSPHFLPASARTASQPRCTGPGCVRNSLYSSLSAACLDAWVPVSPHFLPEPARTASPPRCTGPGCYKNSQKVIQILREIQD